MSAEVLQRQIPHLRVEQVQHLLDKYATYGRKEAAAMGHETGEEEVSRAADDGLRRQGQTRTSAIGAMLR